MHPSTTTSQLETLARHLDRSGFDPTTAKRLRDLESVAARMEVPPSLIEVMLDESAPPPARLRAFGMVAVAIDRHLRSAPTAPAARAA